MPSSAPENSLWPPPIPDVCPNCSHKMDPEADRPRMYSPTRRAVLYEELGAWHCLPCAVQRMMQLGHKIPDDLYNRNWNKVFKGLVLEPGDYDDP